MKASVVVRLLVEVSDENIALLPEGERAPGRVIFDTLDDLVRDDPEIRLVEIIGSALACEYCKLTPAETITDGAFCPVCDNRTIPA